MSGGVRVVSFGYGHGEPPAAHLIFDLREHFRDPHIQPELRHLTARDSEVVGAVLGTPGILALAEAAVAAAYAFVTGPSGGEVVIAFGCAGGRHRSAVVADTVHARFRAMGFSAAIEHRDIGRPVIERTAR